MKIARQLFLVGWLMMALAAGRAAPSPLIVQKFNWHDAGYGATYLFGEDGYLRMDGASGRIDCTRPFARPIVSSDGELDLVLRVVLGHRYHLVLLSGAGAPAIDCLIAEDGRVRFARDGTYVDSGRGLTYQHGVPYHVAYEYVLGSMRPVGCHWLVTSTQYGYVKAAIPPLRRGRLECEFKSDDVTNESCIVLEEYDGTIKDSYIQIGFLHGRMHASDAPPGLPVLDNLPLVNQRLYRVAVAWNTDENKYRLWLDGAAIRINGSDWIHLLRHLPHGIDTITLHMGNSRARMTRNMRAKGMPTPPSRPPLLTYWGPFTLYGPDGLDSAP